MADKREAVVSVSNPAEFQVGDIVRIYTGDRSSGDLVVTDTWNSLIKLSPAPWWYRLWMRIRRYIYPSRFSSRGR